MYFFSLKKEGGDYLYFFIKKVTGAWQGSDRVKLYEELGWESLTDRRFYRRILQLHKIFDGQTPSYLREKLPPNRNSLLNLPNVFQELRHGTQGYLNSFLPDGTKNWNNIITDFDDLPSFEKLKKHLISLYCPEIRPTFNIHSPQLFPVLYSCMFLLEFPMSIGYGCNPGSG